MSTLCVECKKNTMFTFVLLLADLTNKFYTQAGIENLIQSSFIWCNIFYFTSVRHTKATFLKLP